MDGSNFLPQILEIEVYPDLNVVAQTPDLLDIRQCGEGSTQPPLTLVSSLPFSFMLILIYLVICRECPVLTPLSLLTQSSLSIWPSSTCQSTVCSSLLNPLSLTILSLLFQMIVITSLARLHLCLLPLRSSLGAI